jgi:hypothetical protein
MITITKKWHTKDDGEVDKRVDSIREDNNSRDEDDANV